MSEGIDAFVTRRPAIVPGVAALFFLLAILIDVHPILDVVLWAVATVLMGACAFVDQEAFVLRRASEFREGRRPLSDSGRDGSRTTFVLLALLIAALGVIETLGKF
jgi:hypothetical protein